MVVIHKFKYLLNNNFDFKFSKKLNIFFLKGAFGFFLIYLPSFFFFSSVKNNKLSLLFLEYKDYKGYLSYFYNFYKNNFILYSLKLKIRGLGYRIRKISKNLFYFFFNYTNLFYFHIPKNILVKVYKKRLLLVSNDLQLLKLVFVRILYLKKLGPYRILGFRYPKQIIFLKKKIKKF